MSDNPQDVIYLEIENPEPIHTASETAYIDQQEEIKLINKLDNEINPEKREQVVQTEFFDNENQSNDDDNDDEEYENESNIQQEEVNEDKNINEQQYFDNQVVDNNITNQSQQFIEQKNVEQPIIEEKKDEIVKEEKVVEEINKNKTTTKIVLLASAGLYILNTLQVISEFF